MKERITPTYRFVCDRCGKEELIQRDDERVARDCDIHEVGFVEFHGWNQAESKGEICGECFKEFRELAENFFDESNKIKEEVVGKPKAIYEGYNPHDCEAFYRCPVCGKTFGTWSVDMKDVKCPHCKTELEGIK